MEKGAKKAIIIGCTVAGVLLLGICLVGGIVFYKVGKEIAESAPEFMEGISTMSANLISVGFTEGILERLPDGVDRSKVEGVAGRMSADFMNLTMNGDRSGQAVTDRLEEALAASDITPAEFDNLVDLFAVTIYSSSGDPVVIQSLKDVFRDSDSDGVWTVEEVHLIVDAIGEALDTAESPEPFSFE
jgi:hypothetical protein